MGFEPTTHRLTVYRSDHWTTEPFLNLTLLLYQIFFDFSNGRLFCPLFLATLDPGPGNRSLLGLGLRKFPKPRDNQTSVGLHNHALVTPRGFEPAITGVRGRSPKPLEDGAIWSGRQELNLRLSLGMNEHIEIAAKDSLKPFFEFSPCFHYTTPAYGECFTHIH